MKITARLEASSLWSKWGFWDGDMFKTWDWLTEDEYQYVKQQGLLDKTYDPLVDLVRKYLLPEIQRVRGEPIEVQEYSTIHNPIRAADYVIDHTCPDDLANVYVDITLDQIAEAFDR